MDSINSLLSWGASYFYNSATSEKKKTSEPLESKSSEEKELFYGYTRKEDGNLLMEKFFQACVKGDAAFVLHCLENEKDNPKFDPNDVSKAQSSYGSIRPIHLAASNGHVEILKLLITDKNIEQTVSNEETPLQIAAENGHVDCVEFLLKKGANINATSYDQHENESHQMTALHYAAGGGHAPVIQKLLDHNMDVNIANEKGNTPLHLAAKYGHLLAVQTLLKDKKH